VRAEELNVFNENIVGEIKVLKVFLGDAFVFPENEKLAGVLRKFAV
jgi:hypothetical protein